MEFHAGVLVPGFVNAHCHIELAHLQGKIARGCGFAAFAAAVGELRGAESDALRGQAVARADSAMWDEGVDAVGDIANDSSSLGVKAASRIRYRTFAEVFGLRRSNIAAARALAAARADIILTPHSTYSVTDADFRTLCAEGSAPLSVHFMENDDERLLFSGRGALAEWYARAGFRCDFLHYGSPAQRLAASVPPWRSVLLVHNRCITGQDVEIIMNHFTAPVWWVLCPRSNLYISGEGPRSVELLRRAGANICIGTDSPASNDSLSIVDELKSFDGVPLDELLTWATRNGAAALGLGDELGTAAVGRRCGLAVISGIDWQSMRLTDSAAARRIL